ncbi:Bisphosphate nucleotidase, partial [Globisporangium splendens]
MSTSASDLRALTLWELLAACFSVGRHAGHVIRDVVKQGGDLGMVNKADDKYDPQTVADRRSQQRIVHALRSVWPHVQIVGEEGELAQPEPEDVVTADLLVLQTAEFAIPAELEGELDAAHLVLWIDPLDGTKKFAEKKYDEVSVLIGIAYKQRPIAGVMHLPFIGEHGTTYWGGRGIGLFKSAHGDLNGPLQTIHERQERPQTQYPASRTMVLTTSGTKCDLVNDAIEELKPQQIKLGGATGTMVLTVITGESDLFLRFRNATKRWDICAMEPLLEAIGGSLVDKKGCVYAYDPLGDPQFDNEYGLIVSLDAATTNHVLEIMTKIELLRTFDGDKMTPAWLSHHVFHDACTVVSCDVVPKSIHLGKHSSVMKLRVETTESTTTTLFVKRYVKYELPPRSETHWRRDLFSYRTEARFYSHFYEELRREVQLIKPLAVLYGKDADGNETTDRFVVFLESVDEFDGTFRKYVHADCLGIEDAKSALMYLAKLHGAALKQPELMHQAAENLWSSGGWWSYAKRGRQELENAPSVWTSVLLNFASELDDAEDNASLADLGERMVQHAAYISSELFEKSPASLQTIVHGDFKSANLFFENSSREVVAFDWQWCGIGIGALDVAYLLNTSVSMDALENDEEQLLRFYYDQFIQQVQREGIEYSFEAFKRHYVLATLEYARVLISSFWKNMTSSFCAAKATNTNCGLGYRSVPHVLRMIRKLDEGLRFVEDERANNEA